MVPSSPELSRVLPSHWPDLLSYCCPVGAIVGPDHHGDDHDDNRDVDHDVDQPFVSKGIMEQSPGRLAEHLYTAPPCNQDENLDDKLQIYVDDDNIDVDADDDNGGNDGLTLCTPGCRVSASGAPTSSLQSKSFIINLHFHHSHHHMMIIPTDTKILQFLMTSNHHCIHHCHLIVA